MSVYGIYGYHITNIANFSFGRIMPIHQSSHRLFYLLRDTHKIHLTAFLEVDEKIKNLEAKVIFQLENTLSFIEQRPVIIKNKLRPHETTSILDSGYPDHLESESSLPNPANIIDEHTLRNIIIEGAFQKLIIGNDECLSKVIHKNIMVFSNRYSFADISYYLLFSGLESIARERLMDVDSNANIVIANYLQKFNFNIKADNVKDESRSAQTYCHLRNALFHNGDFQTKPININNKITIYKLKDYYPSFRRLNYLTILKELGINSDNINWDYVNYRN
ncbi:hypothetical protein GJX34_01665 [Salmonella enterica]|nr:hypothetical protein [Salmonella enterica]EAQ0491756.1 hypothetical protein [Salmonella enterica]EBC0806915.1 hypothetical protein [Salmonella enterica]EDY7271966.1 hypothetical protein [Salmonella enterica]EEC2879954.1 hypothetical protein [Salmonella enterica]